MQNDLDARYGRVGKRHGVAIRQLERKFQPLSLVRLDETCREWLSELQALGKLVRLAVLSESVRLIWAVDRNGIIWLAFEELVDRNNGPLGCVFVPNMEVPAGRDKLGHPSLINDTEGRIAGELYLDEGVWIINNKSGRFGFISDRSQSHLANVAAEFAKYGLEVEIDFLTPRGS